MSGWCRHWPAVCQQYYLYNPLLFPLGCWHVGSKHDPFTTEFTAENSFPIFCLIRLSHIQGGGGVASGAYFTDNKIEAQKNQPAKVPSNTMKLWPGKGLWTGPCRSPGYRRPGIHVQWDGPCSFLWGYKATTPPKEEVELSVWCYQELGARPMRGSFSSSQARPNICPSSFSKGKKKGRRKENIPKDQYSRAGSCFPNDFIIFSLKQIVAKCQENLIVFL